MSLFYRKSQIWLKFGQQVELEKASKTVFSWLPKPTGRPSFGRFTLRDRPLTCFYGKNPKFCEHQKWGRRKSCHISCSAFSPKILLTFFDYFPTAQYPQLASQITSPELFRFGHLLSSFLVLFPKIVQKSVSSILTTKSVALGVSDAAHLREVKFST